jgi:signal transduction histidine kinase
LVTASAELLSETCDDEDVEEHIETIRNSADHAVELTTSAREMANVMLSTEKELEHVYLRKVLASELEEVRSAYAKAVVTRETTIPPVPVQANDMLGSVFRNLLKNAIQHNDSDHPEVWVSAARREALPGDRPGGTARLASSDGGDPTGYVEVRVADNGPGIPPDRRDAVFGRGAQGIDSQGTGIGLYLVRTLVDSYGGEVWIEDNDPRGAVFVVVLPVVEDS